MIKRDPSLPIVFVHIPKTGGSTLHQLIHANHREGEVYILGQTVPGGADEDDDFIDVHARSIDWLENAPADEKQDIRCLMGHMPFGFHRFLPKGGQYVTMIRHPVERVISHFNYVKRTPDHYLHQQVDVASLSLRDYITATRSIELNNGQVRMLADMESSVPFGECGIEMFDTAWKNIQKHFLFVGIQERFAESIDGICGATGWNPIELESVNVTEKKPEQPDAETLREILEYNYLDLMLHELICRTVFR